MLFFLYRLNSRRYVNTHHLDEIMNIKKKQTRDDLNLISTLSRELIFIHSNGLAVNYKKYKVVREVKRH